MRVPTNKAFKEDLENIKFRIAEALSKQRRSPITITMEVCESFVNYAVKSRFELNYSRYKQSDSFIEKFSISTENFYNATDCYRITENSFRMKLRRPKTNRIIDSNGRGIVSQSKSVLALNFRKENPIRLTLGREEELDDFAAHQHNLRP
jgi:hypothetical protein